MFCKIKTEVVKCTFVNKSFLDLKFLLKYFMTSVSNYPETTETLRRFYNVTMKSSTELNNLLHMFSS